MPVKAKYIKDLPLKKVLDGSESLLVQDSNGTQQASLEVIVDEIKQNSQEKIREIENELAQTNAQLSELANKGTTVEVLERVTKEEIERQIADGTMANLTIEDNSITKEKIKKKQIGLSELSDSICYGGLNSISEVHGKMVSAGNSSKIHHMIAIPVDVSRNTVVNVSYDITVTESNRKSIETVLLVGKTHLTADFDDYDRPITTTETYSINVGDTINLATQITVKPSTTFLKIYPTFSNVVTGDMITYELKNIIVDGINIEDVEYTTAHYRLDESKSYIEVIKFKLVSYAQMKKEVDSIEITKDKIKPYTIDFDHLNPSFLIGNFEVTALNMINKVNMTSDCINKQTHAYLCVPISGLDGQEVTVSYTLEIEPTTTISSFQTYLLLGTHTNSIDPNHFNPTPLLPSRYYNSSPNMIINVSDTIIIPTGAKYLKIYPSYKSPTAGKINARIKDIKVSGVDLLGRTDLIIGSLKFGEGSVVELACDEGKRIYTVSSVDEKIKSLSDRINQINQDVSYETQWKGKKANFLGDSITYGHGVTKKYHEYLKETLNLSIARNYGISGSTIASGSQPMYSRATTMDTDADLICVFGGTNDFKNNKALGDYYVMNGTTRTLNTNCNTFRGALNVLCTNLINRFPDKQIVLFTPLHRELFNGQLTEYQATTNGDYIEDYVDSIIEVGKMFSIPVLDLYRKSGLQPNIPIHKEKYFFPTDGLHPNELGHERISKVIAGFLNSL